MPYNTPAPDFALLAAFDARPWSAVDVVSYNGVNITMPTFSAGEGVYEDGVYFLNGRGVGDNTPARAMGTFADALSTLASFNLSWSVTLTADDRVKITSDDVFTVAPLDDDVLGLGSQTSVPDGLNFSVTGSTDWTRGNYRGERYQFGDTFGTTFDAFRELANRPWPAQDIIAGMRERGSADLDDLSPTNCLEELMRDQGLMEARVILNDQGHVEVWSMASASFAWLDTSFRDRLGFSGNETPVAMGSTSPDYVERLTADYPMPGCLFPSRPFQDHHYQVESVTQARRKIGGGYTSNLIGTYTTSVLAFDLDALLDQRDLYRHFTDALVPYCANGERINMYQTWGDSRRSLRSALVTSTQPAYDLIYTSEDNGDCGRLRCSLVSASYDLAFGSLKRRVPVSMRLEHL
jgi:hypothetical protein